MLKKRINPFIYISLAFLFLLSASGCKKELNMTDQGPAIDNPLELDVSNSFDWKTTREITLEVTGIFLPATIRNTMKVMSVTEDKVYLKTQLLMNQNYTLNFTIPSYETEVVITYGSIRKVVDVTPEVIQFTYLSQ